VARRWIGSSTRHHRKRGEVSAVVPQPRSSESSSPGGSSYFVFHANVTNSAKTTLAPTIQIHTSVPPKPRIP
jgi:hypothetical protein